MDFSQSGNICKHLTVPLCRVECAVQQSPTNRQLRHWIFLETQKRSFEDLLLTQEATKPFDLPERPKPVKLAAYAPPEQPLEAPPKEYISNEQYKRISPELLDLVKSNTVDVPLQREPRIRLSFPTNDGMHCRQIEDDILSPALAAHLRSVMAKRDFHTRLYGIDFQKHKAKNEKSTDKHKYLDGGTLRHLFRVIQIDGQLTTVQTRFLGNFLDALGELNPEQITTYLAIMRANGVLTLDVLSYLNNLLQRTGTKLFPTQMKLLINVFNIMAEAAIRGKKKFDAMTPSERQELIKGTRKNLSQQPMGQWSWQPRFAVVPAMLPDILGIRRTPGSFYRINDAFALRETPSVKELKRTKSIECVAKKLYDHVGGLKIGTEKMASNDNMEEDQKDSYYDTAMALMDIETNILKGMNQPGEDERRREFLETAYPKHDNSHEVQNTFPYSHERLKASLELHLPWQDFQEVFHHALLARMSTTDVKRYPYTKDIQRYSVSWKKHEHKSVRQVVMRGLSIYNFHKQHEMDAFRTRKTKPLI